MPSSSSYSKTLLRPFSSLLFWIRRFRAQKKYMNAAIQSQKMACTIAYNQYGAYCVPNSALDRPASRKIRQGQVYEPQTISFMRRNHKNKDIVHAGTFFGDFLPALSESCSEHQIIWAFEPNPESYACANITASINRLSNTRIEQAGLGEKQDVASFHTHDEAGSALGGGSYFSSSNNGSLSISIVSIDGHIPNNRDIGIIQLDVEGFEIQALKGALKTIERCHPILILEQFPDTDITQDSWFQEQILQKGYSLLKTLHGNLVFSHSP